MAESGSCYVIHGDLRSIGLRRSTFFLKAPFTNLCNNIIQYPTSKNYEPLAYNKPCCRVDGGGCSAEKPAKEQIAHPDRTVKGSISLPWHLNIICSS